MILTPSERTSILLDTLDVWICEEWDSMTPDELRGILDCREVLIRLVDEDIDECDCCDPDIFPEQSRDDDDDPIPFPEEPHDLSSIKCACKSGLYYYEDTCVCDHCG